MERPASVVKELVENALDAGATRIEAAVERGGKRRIRVADDGSGMSREDALLSLDRHATSKIEEAGDLRGVETFGFRGEALPSIAAVSRMTLETRLAAEDVGTRIRVSGGRIASVEDAPRRRGTSVEVERLFHNAPARAKFLKSARAETRASSDVLTALALANPSVALSFTSDDRTLLELTDTGDVAARVAELWGDEEAARLLPISGEGNGIRLRGLIQRPDAAEPGFRRAHLFVNGRPFRDRKLLAAADRGYRTTVAPDVRAWLFLYLQAEPGGVDVNVHPTKAEVRFRDGASVEALIEETVRKALAGEESAATLDTQLARPRLAVREAPPKEEGRDVEAGDGAGQMALFLSGASLKEEREGDPGPDLDAELPQGGAIPPRLFQIHEMYILAETRDGVLLIDQHAAHERILFERLMRRFEEGSGGGQRLLFPLTLRLSDAEYAQVDELSGLLARAGFEVEGFGGDTVIVQAVPDPHPYFDAARCFREMVEELTHGSELVRSARNQHERIAKTFACKGAIKAGQRLSDQEIRELFDQLFATELPHHDVHGRPTIVRLSRAELERKFGR